jgi:DNA repair protein RecO (recombination protein O)
MPLLVTEAIVLHSLDYLDSSRIYRLATRDTGVQSVLARGARNSRVRFGSAMGLFVGGVAHISVRGSSDLQTLNAFDISVSRAGLAADYDRFLGASVIAELVLRFATSETSEELFDTLTDALSAIEHAPSGNVRSTTLQAAWRIVAAMGFSPAFDICASCHAEIPADADAIFSHREGGILCDRCARERGKTAGRRLPATARRLLSEWIEGGAEFAGPLSESELRAHTRLLREFVVEHLGGGDDKPLKAFAMWEHDQP